MVRQHRTSSNHCDAGGTHSNLPVGMLPTSSQWFEEVRCGRTTPNSLEPVGLLPLQQSGSRRFGVVEPPRTHSKLLCRPYSPYITVVRGGSVWSNRPELTRTCPACFPLHHSGSRRFGVVEPHRTHSKLHCRPASPCITVVRGVSVLSNHPKLTRNCPVGLFPPAAKWFKEVRCCQTTPNSL